MINMITKNKVDKIVLKIIKEYKPIKVIIFGSYPKGSFNRNSDIDLFIIKNTNLPFPKRIYELRKLLKNSGFPIDIIIKTSEEVEKNKDVIGSFTHEVFKTGKILYEEKTK